MAKKSLRQLEYEADKEFYDGEYGVDCDVDYDYYGQGDNEPQPEY